MPAIRHDHGRLTPAEAHRRAVDDTAILLDVREAAGWDAGHAPGAIHLPLSRLTAGAVLPSAAAGKQVMPVCRSGHRSRQAAVLLADHGANAPDVIGGMADWARDGLPVTGGRDDGGGTA